MSFVIAEPQQAIEMIRRHGTPVAVYFLAGQSRKDTTFAFKLVKLMADGFTVDPTEVLTARSERSAIARHGLIYLLHSVGWTRSRIAQFLMKRDTGTIRHSLTVSADLIAINPEFAAIIARATGQMAKGGRR